MPSEASRKIVLNIGGAVASSLPRSVNAAVGQLDKLRAAQRFDQEERRKVSESLRQLRIQLGQGSKDTDAYRAAQEKLKSIDLRISKRKQELIDVGRAARAGGKDFQLFGRLSVGALAKVVPGIAAVAAGVLGLYKLLGSTIKRSRELARTRALTGAEAEDFQRTALAVGALVGSLEDGKQASQSLADSFANLRQGLVFGRINTDQLLGLARLGLDIQDAYRFVDDPASVIEEMLTNVQGLNRDTAVASALQAGFGKEVAQLAGDIADGTTTLADYRREAAEAARQAVLDTKAAQTFKELGGVVDQVKAQFASAWVPVLKASAPVILEVGKAVEGVLRPMAEWIGENEDATKSLIGLALNIAKVTGHVVVVAGRMSGVTQAIGELVDALVWLGDNYRQVGADAVGFALTVVDSLRSVFDFLDTVSLGGLGFSDDVEALENAVASLRRTQMSLESVGPAAPVVAGAGPTQFYTDVTDTPPRGPNAQGGAPTPVIPPASRIEYHNEFNITQQPGENGEDLARRISDLNAQQLTESTLRR